VRAYAEIVAARAMERRVVAAGQRIAALRGKDALSEAQRILATCQPRSAGNLRGLRETMVEWFEGVRSRFDAGGMSGIPTSLQWLDDTLDGFQKSDLIILAARPSVGKTALAMQSAIAAAKAGIPTLVFSAEMSGTQICGRIVSHVAGVSGSALRRPKEQMNDESWARVSAAIGTVRNYPITMDDSSDITLESICARARQVDTQQRLGLIVIDYLQILRLPKADRNDLALGEMTRGLKGLAKSLDVPVLLLSQLNRDGVNRPTMAELRGSGAIEQDADVVMFLHRPNDQDRSGIELIVAKQRNGEIADRWLHADMKVMRFDDAEHERPNPKSQEPAQTGFRSRKGPGGMVIRGDFNA
jgi:replicative DNA helicase